MFTITLVHNRSHSFSVIGVFVSLSHGVMVLKIQYLTNTVVKGDRIWKNHVKTNTPTKCPELTCRLSSSSSRMEYLEFGGQCLAIHFTPFDNRAIH